MCASSPIVRTLRCFVSLLVVLAFVSGCEQDLKYNVDFSVNLIEPGPKWPNLKKLPPIQQEVYKKFGKPDHMRLLWDPSASVKLRADLAKELKGKKPKQLPPATWVYLSEGKEIFFKGENSYDERPLTDQVKLVATYGDPEDVKVIGNGVTQWTFYSAGKMYRFANGKIIEQKEFPAMGKYIK